MHLSYILQSHLGLGYDCVVTAHTKDMLLMVLVRGSLRVHVTNVRIDRILVKETEVNKKSPTTNGGLMEQYKV